MVHRFHFVLVCACVWGLFPSAFVALQQSPAESRERKRSQQSKKRDGGKELSRLVVRSESRGRRTQRSDVDVHSRRRANGMGGGKGERGSVHGSWDRVKDSIQM